MFQTKKDLDKHVRSSLSRLRDNEVSWSIRFLLIFTIFICICCDPYKSMALIFVRVASHKFTNVNEKSRVSGHFVSL